MAECRTQPEPREPRHQGRQRSHPASVRPHCPELLPPRHARSPSDGDCSPPDRGLRFPAQVRERRRLQECCRRRRYARPGSGQTQSRRPAWVLANWNSKPFSKNVPKQPYLYKSETVPRTIAITERALSPLAENSPPLAAKLSS